MPPKKLRIATRKSPLALWQANHVRDRLIQHWPHVTIELVPMVTSGDKFLKDKLLAVGGKGLFVKELEEALLDGRADLAVHSMKDVPAHFPNGLSIGAICTRDNPFDAFVSKCFTDLAQLPPGATVGTASLRRQSQLLAIRPDLRIVSLRGNIHTRMATLDTEAFDAIILAAAGLERMGIQSLFQQILNETIMLPACGQGALGIECRTDDEALHRFIAPLNDALTATCVQAERHVNALLGGNCHVPLAVYCHSTPEGSLQLRALVASPDGKTIIRDSQHGHLDNAEHLADQCANTLMTKGAKALLAQS